MKRPGSVAVRLKLGAALLMIIAVAALPQDQAVFGLVALPALLLCAIYARVDLKSLLARAAKVVPFLLGMAALSFAQHHRLEMFLGTLLKTSVSVFTLQLLAATTPLPELLRTLRSLHLPEVLCSTIGLLDRYWLLIVDESRRMRRARAGRTLRSSRWATWRAHAHSIGLLFVRATSRAERVEAAMRARGGA